MREIKFRAWEKNLRAMISVDSINFEAGLINMELVWRTFEEIELMQYTGLKDKNGVEIFEGDIVHIKQDRVEDKYIPHNTNCEISYEDGAFTVKSKVNETEWPINAGLYYVTWKEFEVIGNIYENPELLG